MSLKDKYTDIVEYDTAQCCVIEASSSGVSVYPESFRTDCRVMNFIQAAHEAAMTKFEVILCVADDVGWVRAQLKKQNRDIHVPLLTIGKRVRDEGILIPNFSQLGGKPLNFYKEPLSALTSIPWESKRDLCSFVGVPSGHVNIYDYDGLCLYYQKPRIKMWQHSRVYPSIFVAAIINPADFGGVEFSKDMPYIPNRIGLEPQLQFKGIIDIDGWATTERMFWILLSNCIMMKMESDFINWASKWLVPELTHLTFKEDFSDINCVAKKVIGMSALEAEKITVQANKLANHVFNRSTVLKEFKRAIEDYTAIYAG